MIDIVISLCFSLVQQLATFAVQELRSIPWNVAAEADELNTRLKRLQAFVESRESMHGEWKEFLVGDLRKVAHRIEDVFNSIMQHEAHISSDKTVVRKAREFKEKLVHWSSFKQMNEEIQSIKAEISNILAFLQSDGRQGEAPKKELQRHLSQSHQDSEIFGLVDVGTDFLLNFRATFERASVVKIAELKERWPHLREHLNMVYSFVEIGFWVNE